jgi:hypothetical protein
VSVFDSNLKSDLHGALKWVSVQIWLLYGAGSPRFSSLAKVPLAELFAEPCAPAAGRFRGFSIPTKGRSGRPLGIVSFLCIAEVSWSFQSLSSSESSSTQFTPLIAQCMYISSCKEHTHDFSGGRKGSESLPASLDVIERVT